MSDGIMTRWLAQTRVSTRLRLAFGLMLLLMLILIMTGAYGLWQAEHGAQHLRERARIAQFASGLALDMTRLRIASRAYATDGEAADAQRVETLRKGFDEIYAVARPLVRDTPHAEAFQRLDTLHRQYHARFAELRRYRTSYDQSSEIQIYPTSQRIMAAFDRIKESAFSDGQTNAAFVASLAESHFLLTRLAAIRYFRSLEPTALAEAEKQARLFSEHLGELETDIQDPGRRALVRQIKADWPVYQDATLGTVAGVAPEIHRLRDEVMRQIGQDLAKTADGIVRDTRAEVERIESDLAGQTSLSLIIIGIAGVIALLLALLAARLLTTSILKPVHGIRDVMERLTNGDLDVVVPHTKAGDELADMARSVDRFKDVAVEAVRAGSGLDQVSSNIMIADNDGIIRYTNAAIVTMFTKAEADLRRQLPNFRANDLIGHNIDEFHANPAHQHRIMEAMTETFHGSARAGGRTFTVIANPVLNRKGQRLGTVIEWKDVTEELAIEADIEGMVGEAARGKFDRRIDLTNKAGFFRKVSAGINTLAESVSAVSNELAGVAEGLAFGDLTRRIENDYEGTFRQLKDDFNGTTEKLAEIVERINQATETIQTAAAEVAAGSQDLSERTEQQASSLEETAASMEQLAATVRSNADNAQEVNRVAEDARGKAEKGGTVAAEAIEAMQRIEQSSQKISEIINVIDEIAFQTNLLALNAAVEAARAGDAGRGFAVVAQEVRHLAQRSAQASKEIKQLINDSGSQVEDGVELVRAAATTLQEIVGGVGRVADLVGDIARATTEQANGIEEINTTVATMDEMTQKNAALVEEATAAAKSLEDQASMLSEQMAFFRLYDNDLENDKQFSRDAAVIEGTMIDHINFCRAVDAAVSGQTQLQADELSDHKHCRLGRWYYAVTDEWIRSRKCYQRMEDAHVRVHAAGKDALRLNAAGDQSRARQRLEDMYAASETVCENIEKLASELRQSSRHQAA